MKKSTMSTIIERQLELIERLESKTTQLAEYNTELFQRNDDLHNQICTFQEQINDLDSTNDALLEKLNTISRYNTISRSSMVSFDDLKVLLFSPASPIHKIKIIRQITNCGLKEAKDFHDNYFKGKTMQPIAQDEPAKDLGEVLDRAFYNAE